MKASYFVASTAVWIAAHLSTPASGQILLRDIAPPNTSIPSSSPSEIVSAGSYAVFHATDEYGNEPWRTDGTAAGTFRLRDINAGSASSSPQRFTAVGPLVFFQANSLGLGTELWVTDGTSSGTRLVRDFTPGSLSTQFANFTAFNGRLFFRFGFDSTFGDELWASDGTPGGTTALDVIPGTGGLFPRDLAVFGNQLVFSGQNSAVGRELFASDGTAAGTQPLVDLRAGGSSIPQNLTVSGNLLYFTASVDVGRELYVTDGTPMGTSLVIDFSPGSGSTAYRHPTPLPGDRLVFFANDGTNGTEPWVTDGTLSGTQLIADLNPGSNSTTSNSAVAALGRVFFDASTPATGAELWATDGTPGGTIALELQPGSQGSSIAALAVGLDGVVFTAAIGANGRELGTSDGTQTGTRGVANIRLIGSSSPTSIARFGNDVLFSASDGATGRELWVSDGTSIGTTLVSDLASPTDSSRPTNFVPLGNNMFFSANQPGAGNSGNEPWISDGTPAGTNVLADLNTSSSNPVGATLHRSEVWFGANASGVGPEVFRTDGTPGGTVQVTNFASLAASPDDLTSITSNFLAGSAFVPGQSREFLMIDGAGATTTVDIRPGSNTSSPSQITRAGNRAVFVANDGTTGNELWASDGTVAGTQLLRDIQPGATSPSILYLTSFGNSVVFRASDPTNGGIEPWITDGTPGGTRPIADVNPGAASSSPEQFAATPTRVFFSAIRSPNGRELFVTDGSPSGTRMVVDLNPAGSGSPTEITTVGELCFFFFDDRSTTGRELYVSDGTAIGTRLVADLAPGPQSGAISGLTALPSLGLVAFAGTDGNNGLQVFLSDGLGITQAGRIGGRDGSGAAVLSDFNVAGSTLYFNADDGVFGVEPWAFSVNSAGMAVVQRYGTSCRGSTNVLPRIGATGLPSIGNAGFGVRVSSAPPTTAAILNLAFLPTNLGVDFCRLLLQPPLIALPPAVTDVNGDGFTPLPIPNDPNFVGARLFCQYVVVDIGGGVFGFATMSDGLQLLLGN